MTLRHLFVIIIFVDILQCRNFYPYSYDEIVSKLEKWESEYPSIFKLYTAREKYNLHLPDRIKCNNKQCEHHIIIITNHLTWSSDLSRGHIFLSGALHGNERVGPSTLIELCDYLLYKYDTEESSWIKYLINHRVIILTPMTNSIGYSVSKREEYQRLDPNRDFPYMTEPKNCMKTIVARVINEIFREYLIQLAITFHGGMRAISFEWGSPNHNTPNDYSPDHIAQLELVTQMQILGGHLPINSVSKNTKINSKWFYPIGTLNKVVYPVKGGMEDWAYTGSWDKEMVKPCQPQTYIDDNIDQYPKEKTIYNNAQLRAFNFLIEASDDKIPKNNWGNIKNGWDDIWNIDNSEYDGHISRNLRISMFLINSVQPYVIIMKYPKIIPWHPVQNKFMDGQINTKLMKGRQITKEINWFVSGAISIYEYDLLFAMKTADDYNDNNDVNDIKWNILQFKKNPMWRKNLDLILESAKQNHKEYKFTIDIETKLTAELMKQIVVKCQQENNLVTMKDGKTYCSILFGIRVKVDDQWQQNKDLANYKNIKTFPDGIPPQSHVVNARNHNKDKWNMTNNKYNIKSSEWWYTEEIIEIKIFLIYDDKDTEIVTQYQENEEGDDNKQQNENENETLIIKQEPKHIMSFPIIAIFLFVVGSILYCYYQYKRRNNHNRRIYGNKTYQRVSNIAIV